MLYCVQSEHICTYIANLSPFMGRIRLLCRLDGHIISEVLRLHQRAHLETVHAVQALEPLTLRRGKGPSPIAREVVPTAQNVLVRTLLRDGGQALEPRAAHLPGIGGQLQPWGQGYRCAGNGGEPREFGNISLSTSNASSGGKDYNTCTYVHTYTHTHTHTHTHTAK